MYTGSVEADRLSMAVNGQPGINEHFAGDDTSILILEGNREDVECTQEKRD